MSLLKKTYNIFKTYSRYDIPLYLVRLLTNWWPDLGPLPNLRGRLCSLFIYKCGRNFTIGRDVTILAPNRLVVGNDVILTKGVWLNAFGNVEIEDEAGIGPYTIISSVEHGFKDGSFRYGGAHPGRVKIGRGTWIGAHVVVTAGVTIGRGNLIGANAVVTHDTPDNVFVGGVPAKVISERKDNPGEVKTRHE